MLWRKIPFLITDSTLNFVDTTQRNEALLKSFTIEIQQFQDSILSNLYGFKRFSETKVLQHRPILSIQQHPALSPIHAAMPIRKAATQSLPSATGTSSYSLLLSTRSIDISIVLTIVLKGLTISAITSSTVFGDVHFPLKSCGVRLENMKLFPAAPAMIS